MANEAYFHIKLNGAEKNCIEFFNRFSCREPPMFFYRVRGAGEEISIEQKDKEIEMIFDGVSAFCLGITFKNGIAKEDLFAKFTKELDLRLEAYAENIADECFEHYVYDRGECLVEDINNDGFGLWPF